MPSLDSVYEEVIRPRHEYLEKLVREIAGPRVPRSRIRLCVFSMVGQCMFYHTARPALSALYSRDRLNAERLATHATQFSLGRFAPVARAKGERQP